MNNYDYILKLLNFQDKNIILNNVEFKNNIYYIHIEQIKCDDLSCPKCGGFEITNNFYYTRSIKHSPINVFLLLFYLDK